MTERPTQVPFESGSLEKNNWIREIMQTEGRRAFLAALRIVGRESDAQDVCQESFLQLIGKARQELVENPGAFLNVTIRNTALKMLAKRRRELELVGQIEDTVGAEQVHSQLESMAKRELSAFLRLAIVQLPKSLAKVLIAREFQGLSYARIAKEMGITRNTARVYRWQAVARVKDIFLRNWPDILP